MKPAPFTMHRARSVEHAVELLAALAEAGEEAKVIAGGQSLVPMMNFRLARPDHLIDLSSIDELRRLTVSTDGASIGAMVTQRQALDHQPLCAAFPPMAAGLAAIGHGQIRNRGTIGGSLAHADPAAELPAVSVALDAEIEIAGPTGRRRIPVGELFDGWLTTTLADDELLVAVHLPPLDPRTEWGFEELARRHGDFAMVLAVTVVRRHADGSVLGSRVVLGGVGPTPIRAGEAERILVESGDVDTAAAVARAGCSPAADVHADAQYRSEMVEVLVARCLRAAHPVDGPSVPSASPVAPPSRPATTTTATTEVNGTEVSLDGVADRRLLADWLRDDQNLTGTHLGCEHGVCGACTVLVDGDPVRSCLMFAVQAEGRRISTIESLGTPHNLHPLQEAFRAHHGLQCGFCTPGMVLTALDLLERIEDPTDADIRRELSGNICRCTGYVKIVESVRAAARSTGEPEG